MPRIDGIRKQLMQLRSGLESERNSFISHWKDLSDFILPRRARFLTSDRNNGTKQHNNIIDATATLAARTLKSGMVSGITPPSRPWFEISAADTFLAEDAEIQSWLYGLTRSMQTILAKSNFYNVAPIAYGDIGVFGTACVFVEEDLEQVVRFHSIPVGSFMVAVNDSGRANTFFRDFEMTVAQIIDRFGEKDTKGEIVNWEIFSHSVKSQYEENNLQAPVQVCHCIKENRGYVEDSIKPDERRYIGYYFEAGSSGAYAYYDKNDDSVLSISGYDYFPVLVPRWEVTGNDAYATSCPGMIALGSIKQLQHAQKKIGVAIDKMVNPPLVGPTSLRNTKASLISGDITHLDEREGQRGLRPIHETNFRIAELEAKNEQVRSEIRKAFYEDVILMMVTSDRRQITAREIDERHEEKLLSLGLVLEQLNQDFLDPMIDIVFSIMVNQGLVADVPEKLSGRPVKVDYISTVAQAQKSVGSHSIDRLLARAEQSAQFQQDLFDKIDLDQVIDMYAEMNNVPPGVVRSDDLVAQIRAQREQAAQAAARMQAIESASSSAKNLSQANISPDNALGALIRGN